MTETITLSHLTAAITFAFFASIVFGITQRNTPKTMLRYGVYCFCMFVVGTVVVGWAMWVMKR